MQDASESVRAAIAAGNRHYEERFGHVFLISAAGRIPQEILSELKKAPVIAAAGMAHPERFFDMLRAAGLAVQPLPLPDHFDFATLPWPATAANVLITEKDAVKLVPERIGATRVWVVPLDFRLGAELERALLDLLPPPSNRTPHGHPTS